MAYDLEEQESLAEIKAWWDKWGTLILSVVTAVCLAAAAMQGWRWYQAKESADAGTLYAQMIQAVNAKDNGRAQAINERLHTDYASMAYAGMGALLAARSAEEAGKKDEAVKSLTWITDSDKYPELKTIAAVRLAGVYLDEGKYDEGIKLLDSLKDLKDEAALVADRKGDLLLAKGDIAAARQSWEDGLKKTAATNPLVNVIQTKLSATLQPKE
ncbi:YfgM family protein [Parasutterella muris]|uniref:YfgM family protein n=1 Tax=Parasutterella muris TaxID=2565572 RepID=UPI00203CFE92|nr:tetratricopeptide repeat protein [Parasutterella muris]